MEKYDIQKELGSGSFGRVVKAFAHAEPEMPLAIKMIKMSSLNDKERDSALNQIRLLASIHSPNVVTYHDAFFENLTNTLCIVMEYADGGDLARMISRKREKAQKFNENFIWQVAFDLLRALKTLHQGKIIHRDIKPGNVFFTDGVAKLGDLNISKVTEGGFASTQAGTPYYTSPQIWNGQLYDGRCDIWSLGCLLYECAALRPPFMANDFPSLSKKVSTGQYDPIPSMYSRRLADVIKSCLKVNYRERPSAGQLILNSVFQYMQGSDEGSVSLLNTIRCPRILRMIQQKLPDAKSLKKGEGLKDSGRLSPPPPDLRKIMSEDKMRPVISNISREVFEKENERSRVRSKILVSQEPISPTMPTKGLLYKMDNQQGVHQRAVSPTIYRRLMG